MAVSDLVTKPVEGAASGVGKGAKYGGMTGLMVGALAGVAVAFLPAALLGGGAAVLGWSVTAGIIKFATVELIGMAIGGTAGGLGFGVAGAGAGGLLGGVAGALKGVKRFVEGAFNSIAGKKTGESAQVRNMREMSAASDGELQAQIDARREQIAASQASVADPAAVSGNYAARVTAARSVEQAQSGAASVTNIASVNIGPEDHAARLVADRAEQAKSNAQTV